MGLPMENSYKMYPLITLNNFLENNFMNFLKINPKIPNIFIKITKALKMAKVVIF